MSEKLDNNWTKAYVNDPDIFYPAEGVIRILKGQFPNLDMKFLPPGTKILDLGAGDGRHVPLFHQLGFDSYCMEINDEIVENIKVKLARLGLESGLLTGKTANIPVASGFFDVLLTWNSCYYMEKDNTDFKSHIDEMARVINPNGYIICSVPKKNAFIFDNSEDHPVQGFKIIHDDYFGLREGQVMRCFENREELENSFSEHFHDFRHADLDMEWFGLSYKWHVFVAQRR